MTRIETICRTMMAIACAASLTVAQNANDYRSAATGTWGTAATWERYSGSQWEAASTSPDSGAGLITVQAGHTITIASNVVLDSVNVLGLGGIIINAGVTVTVAFNNDFMGIDVDTTGVVTVNGTILCLGTISGSTNSFVFNDGGVYDHARNAGSVPRADWKTGSTFRMSGVVGNNPDNTNQDFYNVEIDNPAQNTNLNLGMSGNTIHGNVYVKQTGASNRYYLTSPTAFTDPITIEGDVVVTGGVFSTNGSSSAASIVAHVQGDVFVSNANFGSSRGSGTNASWRFHGDTVSFSNATLQNSVSSPALLQDFVFDRSGTIVLRLSNVTYGGSGTSPITMRVTAGTTLDIGTSHITNGNTGSFILDSGATLVTAQNGSGNQGNIECLADLGGGNSFANIVATGGTGMTSVQATKGVHPNAYKPDSCLQRYWSITADPGITEATLTFYYFDTPTAAVSEVLGNDQQYKALRYFGSGNGWFTSSTSTADDIFDFVTSTGETTITGDWTVGHATPDPTVGVEGSITDVPHHFYVEQNFPNPFNPVTTITYGLPVAGFVSVRVFDVLGREVATPLAALQEAGVHVVQIDGSHLTSGVYLYEVSTGKHRVIRRMVLTK